MFSRRNFSWKRWLFLSTVFFAASWLVAYVVHRIAGDTDNEVFGKTELLRRLVLSVVVGFVLSFTKTESKE